MDYYDLLGLDKTKKYSKNEIRKAFLKKARELHPDHNLSPNAEEEFRNLYEAYENLYNNKTNDESKSKRTFFSKVFFDKHMQYWLGVIFGDDMPSFIQEGYEPTGIFGPPYK